MPCFLPAPPSQLCSAQSIFLPVLLVLCQHGCPAKRSEDTRVPRTWVKRLEPLPPFQRAARRST